ncbi:cytidylyltransferase domain-containing protein [Saliphagus infecundisoli]|uniref:Cytidylyltransferase domain-containing protein n=1 Tax=Saliphagus infecundisoli TaxID=1849069 RepID=A0ABD5QIY3_9EURY|nr:acylneuraminate cytidylyltransferase family protein [Saliphagus infecundisoli]
MAVALVPARGGSKGIPGKNVTPFLGDPLIAHTIAQADAADAIESTYVSTDDDEIADASREAGAGVIDRPESIAGDRSPTEAALTHALEVLENDGVEPEVAVLLQCTSPLRRPADIDATVDLVEGEYDSALSACADHSFFWEQEGESASPVNYDPAERPMRQEMADRYRENGSVYAFEPAVLREESARLGGRVGIHEMPELLSFEVDTPEDLTLLEAIADVIGFEATAGELGGRT